MRVVEARSSRRTEERLRWGGEKKAGGKQENEKHCLVAIYDGASDCVMTYLKINVLFIYKLIQWRH